MNTKLFWLCPWLWPREIMRLRAENESLRTQCVKLHADHSDATVKLAEHKDTAKQVMRWIQTTHKANMPKGKFRMLLEGGKSVTLVFLLCALSAFGQASYQKNIFTTNNNPYLVGAGDATVTSNRNTGRWTIAVTAGSANAITNVSDAANAGISLIYTSNNFAIKMATLSAGDSVWVTNNGTNLVIAARSTNGLSTINYVDTLNTTTSNGISTRLDGKVDELAGVATNLNIYAFTNIGPFKFTDGDDILYGSSGALHVNGNLFLDGLAASKILKLDSFGEVKVVPNGQGALTNDNTGGFGWFNSFITASDITGKINIQSGNGNNNTLTNLTVETAINNHGTSTNSGAINNAGVETNWNDTYLNALTTVTANAAYNIPDMALGQTNAVGGTRWLSWTPDFTRRRWAYVNVNASGSITAQGEAGANGGTLSYESPATNLWWTVVYTTSASANADSGYSTTSTAFWPGKNVNWEAVGRFTNLGTNQVRYWMGLTSTTIANMNATDSPTTRHVAAVRASPTSAGDVNFTFVTCDGSACTTTASATVLSTNLFHIRVWEDFANARWLFFLNGVPAATNSANLPASGLGSIFSCRTLQSVAQSIRLSTLFASDKDKITQGEFP